ncbi:hypothetical protein MXB_3653 [Myxobolus squamalis]|nr:hypothetical protein MXB_3653 [Myxobolus squamalis]
MATVQNTEVCVKCSKRVYPLEKVVGPNEVFHKTCFKCHKCNCVLRISNFSPMKGKYYCKNHYTQIFKFKGNYNDGFT